MKVCIKYKLTFEVPVVKLTAFHGRGPWNHIYFSRFPRHNWLSGLLLNIVGWQPTLQSIKPTRLAAVHFWCAKAADIKSLVCVSSQLWGAEYSKGSLRHFQRKYIVGKLPFPSLRIISSNKMLPLINLFFLFSLRSQNQDLWLGQEEGQGGWISPMRPHGLRWIRAAVLGRWERNGHSFLLSSLTLMRNILSR